MMPNFQGKGRGQNPGPPSSSRQYAEAGERPSQTRGRGALQSQQQAQWPQQQPQQQQLQQPQQQQLWGQTAQASGRTGSQGPPQLENIMAILNDMNAKTKSMCHMLDEVLERERDRHD
ncbi:hypothetical protein ABBQ38_011417 [Trebouxia sp. C0009 RCD-2024]